MIRCSLLLLSNGTECPQESKKQEGEGKSPFSSCVICQNYLSGTYMKKGREKSRKCDGRKKKDENKEKKI
jgi:hypothetical protein